MPVKFWMAVFLAAALSGTASSVCSQVQNVPCGILGPARPKLWEFWLEQEPQLASLCISSFSRKKTIEGGVETSDGRLQLTTEGTKHTYALETDKVKLQAGRRVKLKGKRGRKKESGARGFEVRKLVKDEGVCG